MAALHHLLILLASSPLLLSALQINQPFDIETFLDGNVASTKGSSHVDRRVDGMLEWGNDNLWVARSEVVESGLPLALVCATNTETQGPFTDCSFSTPTGETWIVNGSEVTDVAGEAVDGVTAWSENDASTCGLVVQSADLASHAGDWSCSLQMSNLSIALVGYISTEDEVSTNLRLPEDVQALSYNLTLVPKMENTDVHYIEFVGGVIMNLLVLAAKPCVLIHIDEMTILRITLQQGKDFLDGESIGFDFQRTFLEICPSGGFQADTEYQVELVYAVDSYRSGYYAYGFYQKPCERGGSVLCWFTQGEATNARNTFPCLDEPGFKALHTVSVYRSVGWHTLSNMPLASTEALSPVKFVDTFETGVLMSPYLFALAITNYEAVESTVPGNGPHTIWAPAADVAAGRADYAADIGARIINFYGDYFGVEYSLPKMDMCVAQEFGGAMENWGLVLYDPVTLLVDPELVGDFLDEDRWVVASVVAHELAHQWFGNLVTLDWWAQMWLNEGFATYVSYLGAEAIDPANYPWGRMIIDETFYVMHFDSRRNYHWAMSDPVLNRPDIERKFGMFTYNKGGSVIRMMEGILGKEVLTQGLTSYLESFSYSSTLEEDLFFHLEEAGLEAGTWPGSYPLEEAAHQSFTEVMKSWTNQAGYPLVTATRNCSDTSCTLQLSQKWFLTSGSADGEERIFDVPIFLTVANGSADWTVNRPDTWLTDTRSVEVSVTAPATAPIIVNTQAIGYYRVNYDEETWKLIGDTLKQNPDHIHPFSRAKLVCDVQVLALNGDIGQDLLSYVLDGFQDTDLATQWAQEYCANGFKDIKLKPWRI